MFHLVARSRAHRRLWTSWRQGRALWDRILRASPGRVALVLMPDHIHLVHPQDVRIALARAFSGHTRAGGPPIERMPPADPLVDRQKLRRTVRYVHLNPCRAHLCDDPLAWPFSTHRDACQLALFPAVTPSRRVLAFHRYVSSDPHVDVAGSELPAEQLGSAPVELVEDAVSSLTRTPVDALLERIPTRRVLFAAAAAITDAEFTRLGARFGVHRSTVARARLGLDELRMIRQALGDPRFQALAGPVPRR